MSKRERSYSSQSVSFSNYGEHVEVRRASPLGRNSSVNGTSGERPHAEACSHSRLAMLSSRSIEEVLDEASSSGGDGSGSPSSGSVTW